MSFSDPLITFKTYIKPALTLEDLRPLLEAWGLWCFCHSFLLTDWVRKRAEKRPFLRRWGRLLYNLFSSLTLLPLTGWTYLADGPYVFRWPSWTLPLRMLVILVAFYLLFAAFRVYGFWEFLGFKEVSFALKQEGILKRLRHPLYTAGFLLLWVRDQTLAWFWTDLLLSIYLLLGTWLEERKLRRIFPEYEEYAQRVPPFWPRIKSS